MKHVSEKATVENTMRHSTEDISKGVEIIKTNEAKLLDVKYVRSLRKMQKAPSSMIRAVGLLRLCANPPEHIRPTAPKIFEKEKSWMRSAGGRLVDKINIFR